MGVGVVVVASAASSTLISRQSQITKLHKQGIQSRWLESSAGFPQNVMIWWVKIGFSRSADRINIHHPNADKTIERTAVPID